MSATQITKLSCLLLTFVFPLVSKAETSTCPVKPSNIRAEIEEEASITMMNVYLCLMKQQSLESEVADFALNQIVKSYESRIRTLQFQLRMAEQAFVLEQITLSELQQIRAFTLAQYEKEQSDLDSFRAKVNALRIR